MDENKKDIVQKRWMKKDIVQKRWMKNKKIERRKNCKKNKW